MSRPPQARHGETITSTDMDRVSHLHPMINPTIGYDTRSATQHTTELASYSASPGADRAVLDGSTALPHDGGGSHGPDAAGGTTEGGRTSPEGQWWRFRCGRERDLEVMSSPWQARPA
ncbi:hypothetical protein C5F59_000030 [Streptomyces sp. QL37]|uniref:M20 family metallopeptidase n=1 Tax=Streptomyces sp. QL37 TaxID=2093747 RepID=UPI0011B095D0|nr:M20 family metallopeptidase [Streptomyces sp. QL37]